VVVVLDGSVARVEARYLKRYLEVNMRIKILKAVCRLFLPRGVWVGKYFGAYTQRYDIIFGRLDSRGVMQGIAENDLKTDNQRMQRTSR